jgi:hypothetical protein
MAYKAPLDACKPPGEASFGALPGVLLAVVGGGTLGDRRNSEHTVFCRCTAPEKKRAVRTEGGNSGEMGK